MQKNRGQVGTEELPPRTRRIPIAGQSAESLGLDGTETFSITGLTALNEGTTPRTVAVTAQKADGSAVSFDAVVRIDTPGEADYFRHGGILQYVLRQLASS